MNKTLRKVMAKVNKKKNPNNGDKPQTQDTEMYQKIQDLPIYN